MIKQRKLKVLLLALIIWGLAVSSVTVPQEEAAGYQYYRETLTFELLSLVGSQDSYDGCELIKGYLEDVGFDITHTPEESNVMYDKIEDYGYFANASMAEIYEDYYFNESMWMPGVIDTIRPYDLIYMGLSSAPFLPLDHTTPATDNDFVGGVNEMGFHNVTFDEEVYFMGNSSLEDVRLHSFEAQAIFAEELPYIYTLQQTDAYPTRIGFGGFVETSWGLFGMYNPLSTLNAENTTNLPAGRQGKEWVIRYFKGVNEGNPEGTFVYHNTLTGRTVYVCNLLWEPILALNDAGQYVPWLASKYEISADGKTFTFVVRDGIKWHDFATSGEYVDRDDVLHYFDYFNDTPNYDGFPITWDMVDWGPSGTNGFYVTFGDFDPFAIANFIFMYPIPQHIFETIPYDPAVGDFHDSWYDLTNLTTKVGCGPYMFEEVEAVDNPTWWQFIKNDDYWFTGNTTICGLDEGVDYPRMDRLTIRVITDDDATVAAIRTGTVDHCRYSWPAITAAAEPYEGTDLTIEQAASVWRKIMWINHRIFPLSDKYVRQAMAFAIDYDALGEASENGYYVPVYSHPLPGSIYGDFWSNPAADLYRYNVDKARQILTDNGYIDTDGDGVREVGVIIIETTDTATITGTGTTGTQTQVTTVIQVSTVEADGAGLPLVEALLLCTGSLVAIAIIHRRRR